MSFVYVLYNPTSRKTYVGQTDNLESRVADHNSKRGNHFTAKMPGEWVVIYKEKANNRREALVREKQLKSYQGRQFIKNFIPR